MASGGSIVVVSESTLLTFMSGPRFEAALEAQFRELDADGDGFLSKSELRRALESLRLFDDLASYEERLAAFCPSSSAEQVQLFDGLFKEFDRDGDGAVGLVEFEAQMREIVGAIARGLRGCPLHFLLDPGSILARAAQQEREEGEEHGLPHHPQYSAEEAAASHRPGFTSKF